MRVSRPVPREARGEIPRSTRLRQGNRLTIYRFIQYNQKGFGVRWLLKKFQLSPNAYYNFLKQRKQQYYLNNANVLITITNLYHKHSGKPGYRMMKSLLEVQKIKYSNLTIHKYMKELALKSIVTKRKPAYVKGQAHKKFENLLNRDFTSSKINKKCVLISLIYS